MITRPDPTALTRAEATVDETKIRGVIELAKRLPELYMADNHEKRVTLLKLLVSNCRVTADTVEPVCKEPFASIAKWKDCPAWLPVLDKLRTLDELDAETVEVLTL